MVDLLSAVAPKSIRQAEDRVLAMRLDGVVRAAEGSLDGAGELLDGAVRAAREKGFVYQEAAAHVGLAKVRTQEGHFGEARDLLEDVWVSAERGSYVLLHADARNLLAEIERAEGHEQEAAEAAEQAYRLAWCDGPPYAYQSALDTAAAHLTALGRSLPDLPPFDPSAHEPLPEIVIEGPDGPIRI